jgi:uncharacterized protein (TIGR00369 family)
MMNGELPLPGIVRTLGIVLARVSDDEGVCELDTGEQHFNALGTVHGGVFCDLADVAMGIAWSSRLEEGEGFTTLELKTSYLKAVRQAHLVAEARVLKRGKTIGLVECSIREGTDLVAHTTSTVMTLRRP